MVFPLYNEELHLLGKKNILDFDFLMRLCPKIPGRYPAIVYCTAVTRGHPGAGLDQRDAVGVIRSSFIERLYPRKAASRGNAETSESAR
jgi:hypothetical protein